MSVREVVIVGSGPAGYTAAIYAARAGLAPVVVAGSVTAGGALMNTTEVENFPGFVTGIMGPDLMDTMRQQAERFGAEVVYDDAVRLDLLGPVKTVVTGNGETYEARVVILAMGAQHKRLGIPGEDALSGHGVSWCATCDGFFFRDKHVIVVGGGDSACEEATFLARFARQVTLVVRGGHLRASKIMQDRVRADPKIAILTHAQLEAINGDKTVNAVTLHFAKAASTINFPVDGVFVSIGHAPRSELVADQVACDLHGYVQVSPGGPLSDGRTTATSAPGVFACGDLVDHTYRQAITAAASGAAAALDAQRYLEENR